MPANININLVICNAGGYGKCTFTARDARNYLDQYRREKVKDVRGAEILMDEKKKLKDPSLFYTYSFTKGGSLWFPIKLT